MINEIPDRIRAMCREAGISNKSVLVQIARAGNEEAMEQLVRAFAAGEMSRDDLRKQTAEAGAEEGGTPEELRLAGEGQVAPFSVNLAFRKPNVEKSEMIDALRELIRRVESE